MNDETIMQTQLREEVAASEPPITIDPMHLRAQGAIALRRRRALGTGVGIVAVAGVVILGVIAGNLAAPSGTETSVAARKDAYSSEKLLSAIREVVTGPTALAVGPRWAEDSIVAEDSRAQLLDGTKRDDAVRWQATFSAGDHYLDIILSHESGVSEKAMQDDCLSMLAARFADVCDATHAEDGTPIRVVERAAYRVTDGWPVVQADPESDKEAPWYLHQVRASRPDGLIVSVTEVVRAPSQDAASALWTLDSDRLAEIATSPDLWFPGQS